MNNVLGLFIALFLPAFLGYTWLNMLWRDGHLAARIGYGYFIGICLTTLLLYIWGHTGLMLQFSPLALVLIFLTLTPIFLKRFMSQQPVALVFEGFGASWEKIVWLLLIALLITRISGLLLEVLWRPLYPWDAWINWAPKAKVWFELQELTNFVHYFEWGKESLNVGAFALGNPEASSYPSFVPLLLTWTALGLGEWRDNWINLPWVASAVALFLAFYGQLRMLGVLPLACMVITTLLFSIPYLNTHIALAGYAEIWMAAFYCLAVIALINWGITRSRLQFCFIVFAGIACIFTKNPGLLWAATLLLGVLFGLLPSRFRHIMLVIVVAFVSCIFIGGGISLDLWGDKLLTITPELLQIPGLGDFPIEYHPVGEFFVSNYLVYDNWHLLGWLVMVFTPIAIIRMVLYSDVLPAFITILAGAIFIFVVFFLTEYYENAIDATTINRATFHLLPALVYFLVVVFMYKPRADDNG